MKTKAVDPRTKPQFAFWQTDPDDPGASFWMLFEALEDAVSEGGDGVDIYRLVPNKIGRFKRAVSLVRVRASKKAKKRKHT